ncbi:MAG: desulfoferrodoxin [Chlorobi bacterium]|nr:desulfoferrodoxin [Chlorobiota bacterium]
MINRRYFLKGSFLAATGLVVLNPSKTFADDNHEYSGIIYTKDNPGKWSKKVKSHAPSATVEGKKVTVKTMHGMSEAHYIVKHTLVGKDGTVLAEKTFYPKDKAVSVFELDKVPKSFYVTSFCNIHDMWVSEYSS